MSDSFIISTNPARGFEEIGRVFVSSSNDIKAAVSSAQQAYPDWRARSVEERSRYFQNLQKLLEKHVEDIAQLQSLEMGKPIQESRGECKGIIHWLGWQLKNAARLLAPQLIDDCGNYLVERHWEPYGVAAVISPWNYPTHQFFLNTGQILLAGNTVVFKHSEECPLTAQYLAQLMREAQFPPGVFHCLFGDGSIGRELLQQDIHLVSFTGSSKTGQEVYQTAAKKFIPAMLEMGGSSPGIVFDDAELSAACSSIYVERFSNCGQVCCALKRLLVHESVHENVVQKLRTIIESQVVGEPLNERTTLGPLVSQRQLELLESQVADARERGAKVIVGGKRPEGLDGAFYEPTLMIDVPADARVIREETFGPILTVQTFADEEEALRLANDTPYGLSAFVYTGDLDRAMRVSQALLAGQVSINGCLYFSDRSSFGGYKMSGIGRNDGEFGYYSATQMKTISRPAE